MKKIIIFLLVGLVLIIGTVVIFNISNNKNSQNSVKGNDSLSEDELKHGNEEDDYKFPEQIERENLTKGKLQKIDNITDYYILKNCVEKFMLSYFELYQEGTEKSIAANNLYNLLDESYIKQKNIEVDNVSEKIKEIKESEVRINTIFYMTEYEGMYAYFVNLNLRDIKTSEIYNCDIIIVIDKVNFTFSALLDDYVKMYYEEFNIEKEVEFPFVKEIKKNENNQFRPLPTSYNDYAADMFEQIRYDMIYNTERAYKLLEENFRKEKFPEISDFKKYVDENYKEIWTLKYGSHTFTIKENYLEYICKDKGNTIKFIINEESIMEYKYSFEK